VTIVVVTVGLVSALLCYFLIVALRPLLERYALARPNARSSHNTPTAQGGGIAVVAATLVAAFAGVLWAGPTITVSFHAAAISAIILALVGATDDLTPLPVLPRLFLQVLAVAIVLVALPEQFRVFQFLPLWAERIVLGVALVWFVNLVNFMDGLDWMTVSEVLPITVALTLFGLLGKLNGNATLIALALGGALLGFAPFNRPVAKLFLGDVGSLPIGLLTGWCLFQLAAEQSVAAALLLPLYYLADATITLLRRLAKREPVWVAHRSHFYQRATDNGLGVSQVVGRVLALNIVLAALAAATIFSASQAVDALAIIAGIAAVGSVLYRFSHSQK